MSFPTVIDAVKAVHFPAVAAAAQASHMKNEYWGAIYPSGKGYTYSGPFKGGPEGNPINPAPGLVALYHTHFTEPGPSEKDSNYALEKKIKGYGLTPFGIPFLS